MRREKEGQEHCTLHPSPFTLSCHPLAAAICAEALTWLDTPFVDQACCKGAGCDCANLLVGVAKALQLIPSAWRPPPYHPGHHCHHADEQLLATILALGGHALVPAARQPGDIVLFRLRGARSHGHAAILLPETRIVHAVLRRGVITHGLSGMWARYATAAARFPTLPAVASPSSIVIGPLHRTQDTGRGTTGRSP